MLDIRLIRESPQHVETNLKKRNDPKKIDLLAKLKAFDQERLTLLKQSQELRQKRNEMTQHVAEKKQKGEPITELLAEVQEIPVKIKQMEERLDVLEHECRMLLLRIPNLLHKSVPVGKDDTENVEIRRWGTRSFSFAPKDHVDLLKGLGLIDGDRAAKVAGHGFFYYKNELVILEQAVVRFALDFLAKKGFMIVQPPFMMRREPYEGVTDVADFESVMYKIENDDLYLIATAEHPVGAMYMNETLNAADLPLKVAGISPCFRKEVGAHGKYTRGLYRMHQFYKVEQFIFCKPEDSWKLHEQLQKNSEALYKKLGIPFRVVNVCTGDIGSLAAKKYDTEFLMADNAYREIGSNSNCTDYQARRLNIKYREQEGMPPKELVHTLNNTALATSRTLVAILENHQREDGSVAVPKVLQKYTKFRELKKRDKPVVSGS
ncbi:MAG: serine--tRNA ligase [Candidatus Aenigmarchaeota archaeon]|nr:serine--tRNA ligase [Candidatus Aenigmarchaeota archaeon]